MDVDRCVALHNKIFKHGWFESGRTIEEFERECKTWFSLWGDEAEALRNTFSPELVAFLERAYAVGIGHSFFWYVEGLDYPTGLFEAAHCFNEASDDDDPARYIVLYHMNNHGESHVVGLLFDRKHHTAIICPSLWTSEGVLNGRMKWYPLERVLEEWLDMIEKGKIVVDREYGGNAEPWKLVPYSKTILQETIEVFNLLVDEIESRLPGNNNETLRNTSPLIGEAILDTANPRRGFAYHFARKAKQPKFRHIAPGLEIPNATIVTQQPFASLRYDNTCHVSCLPLLLFCATDGTSLCTVPEHGGTEPNGRDSPFGHPFNRIDKYPAGLYLSCTDDQGDQVFEDECKLILPFCIGAKGYARTSDGSRFGENREDIMLRGGGKDTFADLYQPGHRPFSEMHDTRLFSVLSNWLGMVRRGDWKVGAEGVMGGIEMWKEADTEESWEKYRIPPTW